MRSMVGSRPLDVNNALQKLSAIPDWLRKFYILSYSKRANKQIRKNDEISRCFGFAWIYYIQLAWNDGYRIADNHRKQKVIIHIQSVSNNKVNCNHPSTINNAEYALVDIACIAYIVFTLSDSCKTTRLYLFLITLYLSNAQQSW